MSEDTHAHYKRADIFAISIRWTVVYLVASLSINEFQSRKGCDCLSPMPLSLSPSYQAQLYHHGSISYTVKHQNHYTVPSERPKLLPYSRCWQSILRTKGCQQHGMALSLASGLRHGQKPRSRSFRLFEAEQETVYIVERTKSIMNLVACLLSY